MRVLVTGTRDVGVFEQELARTIIRYGFHSLWREYPGETAATSTIIHGCARGIDMLAESEAIRHGWRGFARFPAEWDALGKSAGPLRNIEMLETMPPDVCIAIPRSGSRGTWHMVGLCRKAGIRTLLYTLD